MGGVEGRSCEPFFPRILSRSDRVFRLAALVLLHSSHLLSLPLLPFLHPIPPLSAAPVQQLIEHLDGGAPVAAVEAAAVAVPQAVLVDVEAIEGADLEPAEGEGGGGKNGG